MTGYWLKCCSRCWKGEKFLVSCFWVLNGNKKILSVTFINVGFEAEGQVCGVHAHINNQSINQSNVGGF